MDTTTPVWKFEESVPSSRDECESVLTLINFALEHEGWSDKERVALCLCAEEAIINAIIHGNKGDLAKQVNIGCNLYNDRCSLRVEDEGEGFDATTIPNPTDPDRLHLPGGRGVFLIKEMMDNVDFYKGGTVVEFVKMRQNA